MGSRVIDKQNAQLRDTEPRDSEATFSSRGIFEHALDEKGRVSIPSSFRVVSGLNEVQSFVLTNSICEGARCIEAYTSERWRELERKLSTKSRFDPKVRKLETYYLSRACECAIDSSGRVNIPAYLRSYAGLEKQVVFASGLNGFRIWDKRVWELVFQEAEAALMGDPALFVDVDR